MAVETWLEPYRSENPSVVLGFFEGQEALDLLLLLREKYPAPPQPPPPTAEETWEQQLKSQRARLVKAHPDGCMRSFYIVNEHSSKNCAATSVEAALQKAAYAEYCRDQYEERWSFVSS